MGCCASKGVRPESAAGSAQNLSASSIDAVDASGLVVCQVMDAVDASGATEPTSKYGAGYPSMSPSESDAAGVDLATMLADVEPDR